MNVSASAYSEYPVELFFGLLKDKDGNVVEIPQKYPYGLEWGRSEIASFEEPGLAFEPYAIDVVYLSIQERKFYSVQSNINTELLRAVTETYNTLFGPSNVCDFIVGLGPDGVVAIWLLFENRSYLINVYSAEEILVPMRAFRPLDNEITLDNVCEDYLKERERKDNFRIARNGMKQFMFKYNLIIDNSNINGKHCKHSISECLFDGTMNKTCGDDIFKYHKSSKPQRLCVQWIQPQYEMSALFWFEEEPMMRIFERFYGAHPDTKADFIIRIDAENKKYELSLFRQGLKEPVVIPESAYQMIVFKNKFEDYRSDNYNQPRGAWIW